MSAYGVINISENAGTSRYDGMQVSVQRRYACGLQFGVSYTYSRSEDDGSSLTDVLPNAYDAHAYYGLSDFDRHASAGRELHLRTAVF